MELDALLEDVKIDKERVIKSVNILLKMYGLKMKDVNITRMKLRPSEIWVAAVEECDLNKAKEIMKAKYRNTLPAPITILKYKNKKALFVGSNRSLVFVLKDQNPDCVIVTVPDKIKEPVIVSEAKQTLKQIIDSQK